MTGEGLGTTVSDFPQLVSDLIMGNTFDFNSASAFRYLTFRHYSEKLEH
jgi:hypothetical protein